jgi:uncharacterized protein (DUF2345 family)
MSAQNKIMMTEYNGAEVSGSRALRFFNNQSTDQQWAIGAIANANSNFFIANAAGNLKLSIDGDGKVMIPGDMQINSNLTVNGTTTFINTCVLTIEDPQLELGLQDTVNITAVKRYVNLQGTGTGYFNTDNTGGNAAFPYYVFSLDQDLPDTYSTASNVYITGTGITGLDGSAVSLASNYVSTTDTTADYTALSGREFAVKGNSGEIDTSGAVWTLTGTYTYAGISTITPLTDADILSGGVLSSPGVYDGSTSPALPEESYAGKLQSFQGQYPGIAVVGTNGTGGLISENIAFYECGNYWQFSANQHVATGDAIYLGKIDGTNRIEGNSTDVAIVSAGGLDVTHGSGESLLVTDGAGSGKIELASASHTISTNGTNLALTSSGNLNATVSDNINLQTGTGDAVNVTATTGDARINVFNSSTYINSDGSTLTLAGNTISFVSNEVEYEAGNLSFVAEDNITLLHGNQSGDHLLLGTNGTLATNIYIHDANTSMTSDGTDLTLKTSLASGEVVLQHGSTGATTVTNGASSGTINLYNSSTTVSGNGLNTSITASGNINATAGDNILMTTGAGDAMTLTASGGATATLNLIDSTQQIATDGTNLSVYANSGDLNLTASANHNITATGNANTTAGDNIVMTTGSGDAMTLSDGAGAAVLNLVDSTQQIATDGTNLSVYANSGDLNLTATANHNITTTGNANTTAGDNIVMTTGSGDAMTLTASGGATATLNLIDSTQQIATDGTNLNVYANSGAINLNSSTNTVVTTGSGSAMTLTDGSAAVLNLVDSTQQIATDGTNLSVYANSGDLNLTASANHNITATGNANTTAGDNIVMTTGSGDAMTLTASGGATATLNLIDSTQQIATDGTNLNVYANSGALNLNSSTNTVVTTGSGSAMTLTDGSAAVLNLVDANQQITTDGTNLSVYANSGDLNLTASANHNITATGNANTTAGDNIVMTTGSGDAMTLTASGGATATLNLIDSTQQIATDGTNLSVYANSGALNLNSSTNTVVTTGSGSAMTLTDGSAAVLNLVDSTQQIATDGTNLSVYANSGDLNLTASANHNITATGNANTTAGDNIVMTTGSGDAMTLTASGGATATLNLIDSTQQITTDGVDLNMYANSGNFNTTASGNANTTAGDNIVLTTGTGNTVDVKAATGDARINIFNDSTYISSDGDTLSLAGNTISFVSNTVEYLADNLSFVAGDNITLLHGNQAGDHLLLGTNGTITTNIYLHNSSTYMTSDGTSVDITTTQTAGDITLTHGSSGEVIVTDASANGKIVLFNSNTTIEGNGTDVTMTSTVGNVNITSTTANVALTHGNDATDAISISSQDGSVSRIDLINSSQQISTDGTHLSVFANSGNLNTTASGNANTTAGDNIVMTTGSGDSLTLTDGAGAAVLNLVDTTQQIATDGTNLSVYANSGDLNLTTSANHNVTATGNANTTAGDNIVMTTGAGDAMTLTATGGATATLNLIDSTQQIATDGTNLSVYANSGDLNLTASANHNITATGNANTTAGDNIVMTTGAGDAMTLTATGGATATLNLIDSTQQITTDGVDLDVYANSGNFNTTASGNSNTTAGDNIVLTTGTGSTLDVKAATGDARINLFNSSTYINSDGDTLTLAGNTISFVSNEVEYQAGNLSFVAQDNISLLHGNQAGDHLLLGTNGTIATNIYVHNASTYYTSDGTNFEIHSALGTVELNHSATSAVTVIDDTGLAGKIYLKDDNHQIATNGTNLSITESVGNVLITSTTRTVVNTGATSAMVISNGSGAQVYLGADTGENRITTNNTDLTVKSTSGKVIVESQSDIDLTPTSGIVSLTTAAAEANINLFNSSTYLTSDGTDVALTTTVAAGGLTLTHGTSGVATVTDGSAAGNINLFNSSTYVSANGSDITLATSQNNVVLSAAQQMNLTATAGNYNFTNATSRLILNNDNTYVQGDGAQILVQSATGMNLNNSGAGNVSINLADAGDINLFTQDGYNVNVTTNSALTFDSGADNFYIKYNGSDYLLIHGNNIEAQGNFVSVAIGGSSDQRLKENVTPLDDALDVVMKMRGVNFTWIAKPEAGNQIGFIAQEIKALKPELTLTDSRGFLAVQYGNITALLVESIKKQQQQIADMRKDYNSKISLILEAFQAQSQHIAELQQRMDEELVEEDEE